MLKKQALISHPAGRARQKFALHWKVGKWGEWEGSQNTAGGPHGGIWGLSEHSTLQIPPLTNGTEKTREVEWHAQHHTGKPSPQLVQDSDGIRC